MLKAGNTPVLGFVAPSGTGKTTLLMRLLPLLKGHGLRIGVIKHAHHAFDTDIPGKDSYELRKAGTRQMLVASRQRTALITEHVTDKEPVLAELLQALSHDCLDLVLVEGFKHTPYPKIELHRQALGQPLLYPHDTSIIALATDDITLAPLTLALLDINNVQEMADFVLATLDQLR